MITTKVLTEAAGYSEDDQKKISIRLIIPHARMGNIIGRGGVRIREMQDESSAKITATSQMLPRSTERVLTIIGYPHEIQAAVQLVAENLRAQQLQRPILDDNIAYQLLPGIMDAFAAGPAGAMGGYFIGGTPFNMPNAPAALFAMSASGAGGYAQRLVPMGIPMGMPPMNMRSVYRRHSHEKRPYK